VEKLFDQLRQQLGAIWDDLGTSQRVSMLLSATFVVGGLIALVLWSGRADYRLLYGGLDEDATGKVVAELSSGNIPYQMSPDGRSILVPSDKVHVARMQLATKGLPGDTHVGWEIFDKPNFGISDFIQRANYLRAVQGELARTIGQMDEVESARVMIVKPENRLLSRQNKPATASVFLKVRQTLGETSINAVRFMVANAVEGLTANYVSVVDNRGTVLSENSANDSLSGLSSGQLKARQNLEGYFAQKAEDMLEAVLGSGNAIVRVSANINFETVTETAETYDPEAKVTRSTTTNDERNDSTTSDVDGGSSPGAAINTGAVTNSSAGSGVVQADSRKITQEEFEVSKTISNVVKSAGGIKSLSAAVFIAAKFQTATNGTREIVPRPQADLDKLRRIVESALGLPDALSGNSSNRVVVEEMLFSQELDSLLVEQMNSNQHTELVLKLVQEFGYPALGLILLFLYWRKLRQTADIEIPIGLTVGEIEDPADAKTKAEEKQEEELSTGILSVDAVNRLVKENPDNLTQALRTWMADDKVARN
jgi:flagellar M-ring protein FliF